MHHRLATIPDRVFKGGAACVLRWTDRSGNDIPGNGKPLQLMKVGSKWELYLPSQLAYGPRGAGGDIGPNEALIFQVELLAIRG